SSKGEGSGGSDLRVTTSGASQAHGAGGRAAGGIAATGYVPPADDWPTLAVSLMGVAALRLRSNSSDRLTSFCAASGVRLGGRWATSTCWMAGSVSATTGVGGVKSTPNTGMMSTLVWA